MFPKLFGDSGSEIFRKLQEYGGVNIGQSINTSKTFYVDQQSGDDNNEGTVDKPFKTFEKAWFSLKPFSKAQIIIQGDYTAQDTQSWNYLFNYGSYILIDIRGTFKVPYYQYNGYNKLAFLIKNVGGDTLISLNSNNSGKLLIGTEGYDSNSKNVTIFNTLISNERVSGSVKLTLRCYTDNTTMLQTGENALFLINGIPGMFIYDASYVGTNRKVIVDNLFIQNSSILLAQFAGATNLTIEDSEGNTKTWKDIVAGLQTDTNGVPLNYQTFPVNTFN